MTSFQTALDRIKKAAESTGAVGGQKPAASAFERISAAVASSQPGAAPGMAAGEQQLMDIAARGYEDQLVIPKVLPLLPEALRFPSIQAEPQEVERGLRTMMTQAAQAVATPGMRAKFLEAVLDPLLAVTVGTAARPSAPLIAQAASMALEPSGSGLTVGDLRTEQIAARGAQAGMAAGQQEGVVGDIARGVGQSLPQFAGMAGAIVTGNIPVAAAIAAQAAIPLSSYTAGQLSYMDELDAKRAQEAIEGKELSNFSLNEMQRRATASAVIETGVEVIGAAVGAKVAGRAAAAIYRTRPARAVVSRLASAGEPAVARVLSSKAGQAGVQAFARATKGTGKIVNGFIGNASKIVLASSAEEGVEELSVAVLQAPFTEAPLSKDLSDGLYSAFIGAAAGGIGGVGGVTAAVGRKAYLNRQDAFRPESDAEVVLRGRHDEATKARTNWTAELDETQQAEVSVALNSVNGMAPQERGIFLRDLSDERADIEAKADSLLARRQELNAALAAARDAKKTYEAGASERSAKEALVSEAQAAFDKAEQDLRTAQEMAAKSRITQAKETIEAAGQAANAEFDSAQKAVQDAQAAYEAAQAVKVRAARAGRDGVTASERLSGIASARRVLVDSQRRLEQAAEAVGIEERRVEAVKFARQEVEAAQARLEKTFAEGLAAEGLEIAPGMRIDPSSTVSSLEQEIEGIDSELRLAITDHMLADAKYSAVREKISDMPMEYRQQEPAQVLDAVGRASGVAVAEVKAPKRGGRITKELEALGIRAVWFRAPKGKFGSPAFHSMESRGVVYLNADSDMSQVRAKALHEVFHDIQMFRPEVAKAYADRVGLAPIYEAGAQYARGRAESAAKGRMDAVARIQAAAARAGVEVAPATARAGAARLEQEGQAEVFGASAARVTGRGIINPFVQFAARRGLMGREVAAAMSVIDTMSRAAAVERVRGVKPVATLSPLARTLLWAEDMNVDIPATIGQAVEPSAPAPTTAPAEPAAAGVSMARAPRPLSSFTPEWRAWFGDSKVVDADGNPMVVYHGTYAAEDFDTFRPGRSGNYGVGIYFANIPSVTSQYASEEIGSRVIPAYLSLRNPFVYRESNNPKSFFEAVSGTTKVEITPDFDSSTVLQNAGYDGVEVILGRDEQLRFFVAFKPNQIKSVFNERPTQAPGISMARASDADYLAAVERGDMETVQRMVDEAARAAGYRYVGYHASMQDFKEFLSLIEQAEARGEEFDYEGYEGGNLGRGFYFTPDLTYAKRFGTPRKFYLKIENIVDSRQESVKDRLKQIYADIVDEQGGAEQGEAYDALMDETNADGVIAEDAGGFAYGATELLIKRSNQAKLADPVTRDEAGNVIPLSKRFDVMTPLISYAREADEITSLREQVAALQKQIRDVQNVTAAQRVNALREVRVLERRIVTAERIAEQKTLQATRAKMRVELEKQAAQQDVAAADAQIAKLQTRLDAAKASVQSLKQEVSSLRRGENVEQRLADAEETAQRAIDFAYAIGRREGLVAGQVEGQRQERRQVRKLSERLSEVERRLDEAVPALRDARKQIKSDAAAAQRAIDFAYGMGLAKGRIQGVMEGRRQVLRRMAQREDTLQRQLFDLRRASEMRAEQREELADTVRRIATDAANMLPVEQRGPLAIRIANATTVAAANRIAVEAVKLAANAQVADSIAAIRRTRRMLGRRGMTYGARTGIEALLNQAEAGLRTATGQRIRATVQTQRGAPPALVNAVDIYAAVVNAAAQVEQAVLRYQVDRQNYLAMRAARIARYDALRQGLVANMVGRPTLADAERADRSATIPFYRRVGRANSDIYTMMLELEGTEAGIINDLLVAAQAGKGEASLEHATILRQIIPALQAAGYASIDEYALRNGMLGDASANLRTVQMGGEDVTLPVGTILSVAAMDDETLGLFPDQPGQQGQAITFAGATTTRRFYPTRQDIEAIRAGLSAEERGIIDAMKNILETQIRDRVMDAVYAVEGDQPPVVQNYWPRVRLTEQRADASILNATAGNLVRGALTNVGFAQARVGGRQPLVYRDAFQTWERHVQVALDMIHMAQPYRDASTVLTDPAVVDGIDRQFGEGTAERVLAVFSNGVGATARSNPTIIDKLTNNVTGAVLALRPRTLAKVLVGGQLRLASEIPLGYWSRGVARAASRLRNPAAWDARVAEIHAINGYFNRRHQLHMRSIISGSLSDAERMRIGTAWQSMVDSFRAAGQNLVAAQLTDASARFKDASNGANMMIASVVDMLRYMDEQIMLAAVEARLSEVEDEGILTGQDALREASLRAERDFRRTQNASDEFDDTLLSAHNRVRGSMGWRIFFPFSSDPLKARNQIRRAYLSGNRRLETGLAIGSNAAASTVIGAASMVTVAYMASVVASMFGGEAPGEEEDKQFKDAVKSLPVTVANEIMSSTLGYLGIVLGWATQAIEFRRSPFTPIAVRPIEQTIREATGPKPVPERIIAAMLAFSQFAGNPLYGLYQFVRDFFPKPEAERETQTPAERLRSRLEPEAVRERIRRRTERLRQGG